MRYKFVSTALRLLAIWRPEVAAINEWIEGRVETINEWPATVEWRGVLRQRLTSKPHYHYIIILLTVHIIFIALVPLFAILF